MLLLGVRRHQHQLLLFDPGPQLRRSTHTPRKQRQSPARPSTVPTTLIRYLSPLHVNWAGAACQGYPVALWYVERGHHSQTDFARAVCARCQIREECLDYAVANHEQHGIWGGTSEKERRIIRRARQTGPPNSVQTTHRKATPNE